MEVQKEVRDDLDILAVGCTLAPATRWRTHRRAGTLWNDEQEYNFRPAQCGAPVKHSNSPVNQKDVCMCPESSGQVWVQDIRFKPCTSTGYKQHELNRATDFTTKLITGEKTKNKKFPEKGAFDKFGFRELNQLHFPKTLDKTRKMYSMSLSSKLYNISSNSAQWL